MQIMRESSHERDGQNDSEPEWLSENAYQLIDYFLPITFLASLLSAIIKTIPIIEFL